MIPKNIKKAHILEAITYIDENSVPESYWYLLYKVIRYEFGKRI
jgi:hypothetical protein